MKTGQIVEIYNDPITRQKPQGKAKLLIKLIDTHNDWLKYWRVKFLSDNFIADRFIYEN